VFEKPVGLLHGGRAMQGRCDVGAVVALAVATVPLRVGAEDGFQAVGVLGLGGRLHQLRHVLDDLAVVPRGQDRGHVREVLVERRAPDAAGLSDAGHADAGQAVLGDQAGGGVEDRLADGVAVVGEGLAPDLGHGFILCRLSTMETLCC